MQAAKELERLKQKIESGELPPDEPVFVLRAQDLVSTVAVRKWAEMAADWGAPPEKLREALELANQMRDWPVKQIPGRPETRIDRS